MMKVVFASGGTGGHIYPALAIADEMNSRYHSFDPLFVGTRSGLESELLSGCGYELKYIVSKPLRGRKFWGRVGTLAGLAAGIIQALVILTRFNPDLVIGFGGYASASVVIAGALLRKPVFLQEQNSIPGMANRVLSRLARRIYLGFEHAGDFFRDGRKLLHTGNPLRRMITENYTGNPHSAFGLNPGIPTLLVFGGSQGASSLNRAALEYFRSGADIQGIIQTGTNDFDKVKSALSELKEQVFVSEFIQNIREAYEAADIVLARAGALSVAEIASVGIPSILVPYPFAADDHQSVNARFLEESGGAVTVRDSELSGDKLRELLAQIIGDEGKLERMRSGAREKGAADAARRIVEDITGIMEGRAY
ncbi:MAG: undecaprenyldiphospho-muramoylpentapeptide beta-N-acetylglucosaminyltransferase [Candidatus Latescibacteria bacterium]|nr:undecaprenyldiphospho-muramoylpentapeptide beta-N-acetylglucosaminyltransferase [bacterium]MBD3423529.1 undecaprenyldiphospho-muramoylpentapeptide beta-N-acetylglucosaminyltransferase [Candidatus Latescibacterota bacterium]